MHKSALEKSVDGLDESVSPLDVGFLDAKDVGIEVFHGLDGSAPLEVIIGGGEGVHVFGDDAESRRCRRGEVTPVVVVEEIVESHLDV